MCERVEMGEWRTLSRNQPADEPLLLWPMVIFFSLPRLGASMVNLSSVPRSKLSLSLSSRLSPAATAPQSDTQAAFRATRPRYAWEDMKREDMFKPGSVAGLRPSRTCVSVFPEDVEEDVGVGAAALHVGCEHAHDVLVHCGNTQCPTAPEEH